MLRFIRIVTVGLLATLSINSAQAADVEFTEFGTKLKYSESDFLTNGGQSFAEGWGRLRSNKWRGKCFITTPKMNLSSPGSIFVTVYHKTSWHGFLEDMEEAWDVELFNIKVRYKDSSGRSKIVKKYVSLMDLPDFRETYRGDESDHFRAETSGVVAVNLDEAIGIDESASDIEASICMVGPGTRVIINQVDLETDALIEDI